ncbi:hypothetical protein NQD34_001539 [Periophthalmus magnuspinnatus]|nr:hypothetical protein NQD34_001539 [Periophthalmus magnuspinnatus]
MRTSAFKNIRITALYMALIWSHLTVKGSEVLFASPGQPFSLPCVYPYEDHTPLPELSVQWKSPQNQLLCHFVKHKSFLNCSSGYHLSYRPARISLAIERVQNQDYGTHLCSVSKRHEFTDTQVQLSRQTESVTPTPGRGVTLTVQCWTFLLSVFLLLH